MLTFGIDWDDVISPLNDCAIELANEEYDNYKFEVRTTAGSSANLRLLSDNYIELGIAQADLLNNAYKKNSNLRAIAGLYTEACQLVVKADSDIK